MRTIFVAILLTACGSPSDPASPDASGGSGDAPVTADAPVDAAATGFGELSGMCGVLNDPELTGATPLLVHDALTFARRFDDPADRPLLTPGGLHLIETPNAGGSSVFSEVFAYEQLARCELAALLKTETEIIYDTQGKITDLEVLVDGHKIGVSVTRAVQFPFGTPYTVEAATTLITRKLTDIQASTANVSAADRWEKQILAVLAWDDQHAAVVEQVWSGLSADVRADTIVVVTVTNGDDLFIYSDM